MKRLLLAAVTVGTLAIAGAAQAGWPHGNPHFVGYHHDHFDRCREAVVQYYPQPVIYRTPVVVASPILVPQPTCGAPVVYDSYYRPAGNVALYGRNFGVQFNW